MESVSVFNTFDYIVVGVVLLSAFLALMRGFVREFFSLVAWVGAYFIAITFFEPALPWAQRYVKNDQVAEWTAMGIVFIITLIVLMIVGHFICGFVKGKVLTVIDRSLGFLYGLARGALVICLVYLGVTMIFWPDIDASPAEQQQDADRNTPPEFLLQAKTRPIMAFGADILKPLLPEGFLDKDKMKKDANERRLELEKTIQEKMSGEESSSGEENGPIDIDKLFNGENK
ncbi:MAG: CvpA family protein [Bdellovibrionales bacterium]